MRRSPVNPVISREDVPDVPPRLIDATAAFNPGAVSTPDGVSLLLRVQTRGRRTLLVPADSDDGVRFTVRPVISEIAGLDAVGETLHHIYDPRITVLDGAMYVVFAADTDNGCRLGIARTTDLERLELVSFDPEGDRRNGVLFPERVGGRYLRLQRPNTAQAEGSPTSGSTIELAESGDLVTWRVVGPVMEGRWHYWDELIGAGPPPVRTADGWLLVYHGVATHFAGASVYQAGAALLDLDDPTRVIARTRDNVLEPRETYEMVGQVPNVVFPSGMVVALDDDGIAAPDARVRLYYGAADLSVCMASTTIGDLLRRCHER